MNLETKKYVLSEQADKLLCVVGMQLHMYIQRK